MFARHCFAKTCAVRPVFARAAGELEAADPSKCPRGHKANARGAQSEAPRRSWKAGHQQHPKPDNQDSQHKPNQTRSLPTPHSLNASPVFIEKPLFLTEKCFVASLSRKSKFTTSRHRPHSDAPIAVYIAMDFRS